MYFEEAQVKSLVLTLKEHFPGAELVFDAYSPFLMWSHNLRSPAKESARTCNGPETPPGLEGWSEGIRLLYERYPSSPLSRASAVR